MAELYAEGARFRSQPFRDLQSPRAYAEWAFSEQDEAECWFGEPIVADDRAVVEYWGSCATRAATRRSLASRCSGSDGRVIEQHDYWNSQEGRVEPPDGWGA